MAISPVSSVSFRSNYGQVNFEGRKEGKSSGMSFVPNVLKAIPLATMIAMSPLNSVNAQTSSSCPEVVIAEGQATDGLADNAPCAVQFISNDCDDSDAEKIMFAYNNIPVTLPRTVNGVKKNFKFESIIYMNVDKAEVIKSVAKYKNKPDVVTYKYCFSGGGYEWFKEGVAADGTTYGKGKIDDFEYKKVYVKEDVFKQCIDNLGGNLKATYRTETYNGDAEDELNNLFGM